VPSLRLHFMLCSHQCVVCDLYCLYTVVQAAALVEAQLAEHMAAHRAADVRTFHTWLTVRTPESNQDPTSILNRRVSNHAAGFQAVVGRCSVPPAWLHLVLLRPCKC
jgi:hypothetical protein